MTQTSSKFELSDGDYIAYNRTKSKQKHKPTIVFLGGFMSDMQGTKALALEAFCQKQDIGYLRFDYFGHGESSRTFEEGTIGQWKDNVLTVIDFLTEGPLILVGSSMGGWLMLLAALERKERISALLGIAAAPDFTEDLMWEMFDGTIKSALERDGLYHLPTDYCNDPEPSAYPITMELIKEGRHHLLMRKERIALTCPVRLVHGMQDQDVPYLTSVKLAEKLQSHKVQVVLDKQGDHRMSEKENLNIIYQQLSELYRYIAK